jgi:hypothetical protein
LTQKFHFKNSPFAKGDWIVFSIFAVCIALLHSLRQPQPSLRHFKQEGFVSLVGGSLCEPNAFGRKLCVFVWRPHNAPFLLA